MSAEEDFDGWAFLELMGHRRLGGRVRTVVLGGAPTIRIDLPDEDDGEALATQYYSPAALYCLTPATEETVRAWIADRIAPPPSAIGAGRRIEDVEDLDGYGDDYL